MDSDGRVSPLVSICMTTCNGAEFVDQAVDSALSQTYQSLEIVIVDDASDADLASYRNRLLECEPWQPWKTANLARAPMDAREPVAGSRCQRIPTTEARFEGRAASCVADSCQVRESAGWATAADRTLPTLPHPSRSALRQSARSPIGRRASSSPFGHPLVRSRSSRCVFSPVTSSGASSVPEGTKG